jgi:hypothetical protein
VDLNACVTAAQGARVAGVSRHLVGTWVAGEKLRPVDRSGRSPLYRLGDILAVERDTRRSGYSHRRTAA